MIPRPKILVVDDDQPVLMAIAMTLRYSGFTVITATSPEQALSRWKSESESIGAVIADLDLRSSITGEQLCNLLRADESRLFTILLTAHSMEARVFGRIEGLNFFQKPYDVVALVQAVKDLSLLAEAVEELQAAA